MLSRFSCIWLCNPVDCSLPGFSVHGIPQARILKRLSCPPPRDLPELGIQLTFLRSPALTGRLFTTHTTWGAHNLSNGQQFLSNLPSSLTGNMRLLQSECPFWKLSVDFFSNSFVASFILSNWVLEKGCCFTNSQSLFFSQGSSANTPSGIQNMITCIARFSTKKACFSVREPICMGIQNTQQGTNKGWLEIATIWSVARWKVRIFQGNCTIRSYQKRQESISLRKSYWLT